VEGGNDSVLGSSSGDRGIRPISQLVPCPLPENDDLRLLGGVGIGASLTGGGRDGCDGSETAGSASL